MDGDGVSHELDRVNVKFTMYIIQDINQHSNGLDTKVSFVQSTLFLKI